MAMKSEIEKPQNLIRDAEVPFMVRPKLLGQFLCNVSFLGVPGQATASDSNRSTFTHSLSSSPEVFTSTMFSTVLATMLCELELCRFVSCRRTKQIKGSVKSLFSKIYSLFVA